MAWKGGAPQAPKGAGKGKPAGKPRTPYNPWGIRGLQEAMQEALSPVAPQEPELLEIIKKACQKIQKVSDNFAKDDRVAKPMQKLSPTHAKSLVEELVASVMDALQSACWDQQLGGMKAWFGGINFTQVLLLVVLHTFSNGKIWARVLKPQVLKFIQDGIQAWTDDQRITGAIDKAVKLCGIQDSHESKAIKALTGSYEQAHFQAPYGTTQNDSAELRLLQDFVQGWMEEFCHKGWDVLENGFSPEADKEQQIQHLGSLFQSLLDPSSACIPTEIGTEVAQSLGGLPASPWPFIQEAAKTVIEKNEAQNAPKKPKLA